MVGIDGGFSGCLRWLPVVVRGGGFSGYQLWLLVVVNCKAGGCQWLSLVVNGGSQRLWLLVVVCGGRWW